MAEDATIHSGSNLGRPTRILAFSPSTDSAYHHSTKMIGQAVRCVWAAALILGGTSSGFAQTQPPEPSSLEEAAWQAALEAMGAAREDLQSAVMPELWEAYRQASFLALRRMSGLQQAAPQVDWSQTDPTDSQKALELLEFAEQFAPTEAEMARASVQVEMAAGAALELVAPKEWARFKAAERIVAAASLALAIAEGAQRNQP